MSKNIQTLLRFAFALIIIVVGNYVIVAQTQISGDWKADFDSEKNDKIHLSFERRSEKNGRNQMGQSFNFADLKGLSREQAKSTVAVNFSLVREAGTIECDGRFENGKGTGTFQFKSNPNFVSAMKSRGFDFEKPSKSSKYTKENELEDRLFAATTINLTTAIADDLRTANFENLDVEDLFKAAIFKIDGKFMAEMKATGFPDLTMADLVKARIFKVDADYVRQVREMGFEKQDMETLTKLRIFKVTPEFIAEVRNEGLTDLDVEDLIKMRIFKIDAEFIRQAKAENVPLEVEKLVQKRIGVWNK